MSGESFDQMSGLTFADLPQGLNGTDARPKTEPNPEVEAAFHEERELRAMCPKCRTIGQGTFAELSLHIETCDASG